MKVSVRERNGHDTLLFQNVLFTSSFLSPLARVITTVCRGPRRPLDLNIISSWPVQLRIAKWDTVWVSARVIKEHLIFESKGSNWPELWDKNHQKDENNGNCKDLQLYTVRGRWGQNKTSKEIKCQVELNLNSSRRFLDTSFSYSLKTMISSNVDKMLSIQAPSYHWLQETSDLKRGKTSSAICAKSRTNAFSASSGWDHIWFCWQC